MVRAGLDDDEELQRVRRRALELDSEIQARALSIVAALQRELRRRSPRPRVIRSLAAEIEEMIGEVNFRVDEVTSNALAWAELGMLGVYLAGADRSVATAAARLSAGAQRDALRRSLLRAAELAEDSVAVSLRRLSEAVRLSGALDARGRNVLSRRARRVLLDEVARVRYSNGARHPFGSYVDMLMNTRTTLMFNQGTADEARRRGVQVMETIDGRGCGWAGHGDPLKADGRLVTVGEATGQPISHPNCVRQFTLRPDLRRSDL